MSHKLEKLKNVEQMLKTVLSGKISSSFKDLRSFKIRISRLITTLNSMPDIQCYFLSCARMNCVSRALTASVINHAIISF